MNLDEVWRKQSVAQPLFPDLLWSRPENRAAAGKLLVIGGNVYGFAAPATAYTEAAKAGIGVTHVLLPDKLKHMVGHVFEAGDFAPSTPSGSFSQKALDDFLAASSWADGVLLAGDLGHNSETAIVLEKFAEKYAGQLTLTKDAADYFTNTPRALLSRTDTTFVASIAQLQRLAMRTHFTKPFTFDMGLVKLVETLRDFTTTHPINIVVKQLGYILVAGRGVVSSTKLPEDLETWRVRVATYASVWWLQNPSKPFESLTTAVYDAVAPTSHDSVE